MCRTKFYTKIKEITDKTPTEYMHYFKMNKAKNFIGYPTIYSYGNSHFSRLL